jgi:hypothetical protein
LHMRMNSRFDRMDAQLAEIATKIDRICRSA